MEFVHLKELLSKRGEKSTMSKSTNISTGNISDWFNPKRESKPSIEALCKMATYFNCSVDYLLDRTENMYNNTTIYKFPVYDQEAAAGAGIYGRDGDFEMEDIVVDNISSKAIFGVRIKGHSMEPTITDNSIVLLNPKITVEDAINKNVVVSIDGDVICKHLTLNGEEYCFESLNPEYQKDNRITLKNNFKIIGEIVNVLK